MGTKRHILILFPHLMVPGGAATAVFQIGSTLLTEGYKVSILCAKANEEFIKDHRGLDILPLNIPMSSSPFYWVLFPFWQFKIYKSISTFPNSLLFPQVLPSNWWAWIYKKLHPKTKVIWYCQEPSAFIHSKIWIDAIPSLPMKVISKIVRPFTQALDIWLERSSDLVICNSEFTLMEYEKVYNRRAFNVVYPPFKGEQKELLHAKRQDVIFTIGRLTKFKRIDTLIRVFEKFQEEFPSYKLIIAGTGEYKEALENISRNSKAHENIEFLGRISDDSKADLFSRAKVSVITAHHEPFGIVPLESMSQGTPVIAHGSGGPKESILDGETGFLYNDETDLLKLLIEIATMNDSDYLKMQKACTKRVQKFNLKNAKDQLVAAISAIDNESIVR